MLLCLTVSNAFFKSIGDSLPELLKCVQVVRLRVAWSQACLVDGLVRERQVWVVFLICDTRDSG